ncbi:MAG TPA: DUF1488 domain-containing protein [Pseudaminobacter sp.]|jgi:hypothetical protein|nr:DUF1488 domain-containing protein [Pseudaminobacter sp.]
MALTFPNLSRSYDAAGKRIRFLGHDGMVQISFSVEIDAISKKTAEPANAEIDYLAAFDAVRGLVHDMARNAYSRGRKNMYALTSADFK